MENLKLITMSDVETEQVKWLLKPFLPFGKITLVQGNPGEGKTNLMLAIAADLTQGRELPDGSIHEPSAVIFQTAEDGLTDTIKPRLEMFGADCSKVHVIDDAEQSLSLTDERIEQAIISTSAKLVILDPIQAYCSSMNSADGVRPMMKSLASVAERTGCAIVIIGHLRKTGGKSSYRGLGSIDIYAACRSVLVVGRIGEDTRAVVQDKCNLAPIGESLAFELDPDKGFQWLGECSATVQDVMSGKSDNKENPSSIAKQIIVEELYDGSEVAATTMLALAKEEGISEKTLKRVKSELGVVSVKRADGWYWSFASKRDNDFDVPCPTSETENNETFNG